MTRKRRSVRYSDEEWEITERRGAALDMDRSEFIRKISTGKLGVDSQATQHKLWNIALELRRLNERLEQDPECDLEHQAIGALMDRLREALSAVGAYNYTDTNVPEEEAVAV